jgi:hypothetical protein
LEEFKNRYTYNDLYDVNLVLQQGKISPEDRIRLLNIRRYWNFYEGYHWEEIPPEDKPQVTENYCRAFVNKFVAFEFGKGFSTKMKPDIEKVIVNDENQTVMDYLMSVWKNNKQDKFSTELGQSKSISGDGWVQVRYADPNELIDPFGEFPKGMIKVTVIPTNIAFAEYNEHDKDKLERFTIQYPIDRLDNSPILKRIQIKKTIYKQIWTREKVEIWEGEELIQSALNDYGIIPFVQIKNFPIVGKTEGLSDLEDLIPLNTELNTKKSDISEIIDYHSAPITIVYGAKVSSLEKGANRMWGGLPKDAKVENLNLNTDLGASVSYVNDIKKAMHEIGGIPEGSLGGQQAISNTSGVALQFVNMPLIERTRIKRMCSQEGLELVNKLILLISVKHGLIKSPQELGISPRDFYHNEVTMPDTLPKDTLIELQQIQQEMQMGLEEREGAMQRLGKDDIQNKISKIDKDRKDHPDIYTPKVAEKQLNSGMTNGQTAIEQVRRENNGANMPKAD